MGADDEWLVISPGQRSLAADNQLEFWQKLVEVGNDLWMYGAWRVPSLIFKAVVVSGV